LQCTLPALAASTQVTPAVFQQINVTLLDNSLSSKVANNNCGTVANCVVVASNNTIQAIGLTGEAQTGITIPAAQIATGNFKVDVGQTKTLNLSVNACASIVVESNGQLRLKPVMFAGEVSPSSTSISGRVLDGVNQGVISGGRVVVALELKDGSGTDRVIQATVPDGTGAFSFCSLPAGNYDVVAIATNGLNVAYGATLAAGVPPGTNVGNIPIFPQPGPNQAPANITGQITTVGASGGVSVDLSVSMLQSISVAGKSLSFTVPQVAPLAPTLSIATEANGSCPANTNCGNYTLTVPATNPMVGVFATTGTTYSQVTGSVPYVVDAFAFVPGSGNTPDCSPTEMKSIGLSVSGGATVNAPVLAFLGCR
jgi:hypothetical protein